VFIATSVAGMGTGELRNLDKFGGWTALFVMRPHSKHFDDLFGLNDRVNKAVLKVDSSRV
jgi:hypothetical protein